MTEESGRLQSMGLQSVGHNWVTEHYCYDILSGGVLDYNPAFMFWGKHWFAQLYYSEETKNMRHPQMVEFLFNEARDVRENIINDIS